MVRVLGQCVSPEVPGAEWRSRWTAELKAWFDKKGLEVGLHKSEVVETDDDLLGRLNPEPSTIEV
jgi:hypothetical protein